MFTCCKCLHCEQVVKVYTLQKFTLWTNTKSLHVNFHNYYISEIEIQQ